MNDSEYLFKYSNYGMAVLGVVLEQIYVDVYTQLMNDYISDELGLKIQKFQMELVI